MDSTTLLLDGGDLQIVGRAGVATKCEAYVEVKASGNGRVTYDFVYL